MKLVSQVVLFLLCAGGLSAQSFYGSLRGRVVDQSGSVIPGAMISLMDEGTGLQRSTVSSAAGEFTFASLNPATYVLGASSPGFKLLERSGVVISTQSAVTIDLEMEIGAVTEQVFVTEEVPLLETANASTGTVVDRQKLIDLPNLGRNAFMLSKLSEAIVQTGNPKFNRMQDQSGSSSISIAGGPVRGNNYTLDGVAITDSSNRAVIIPSLEAVEEVKVQANTYDAEMGRTGGGTFNTTLKSGTNKLNFSAFGYIRETEWLANNFFANRTGTPKIDQPFRNFGGSIGGPVIIPKVYDGRNKTFFWISGEAYRQTESASTELAVPTGLERIGDFSQSLNPAKALSVIYDPLTTTNAGVRTPFANNILPGARIDAAGLTLASYYPMPNLPAANYAANNLNVSVGAYNRADQTTWKLDQEVTSWLKLNMSYLHYGSQEPGNAWFGGVATPGQGVLYRKVDATQVNAIMTPTPTTVVAIRYGFNRFPNFSAPTSLGFDLSLLKLPSSYTSLVKTSGFPSITMGNLANYGGSASISQSILHSKSWNGTVSKFMGKHSLKVGIDYRQINSDQQPASGPGSFGFTNAFTRQNPNAANNNSGADIATMLLGYPTSGSISVGDSFFNYIRYTGIFVQDDFRVNTKLTLNFGLRYEYETAPQERDDHFITGIDLEAPNPLQATVSNPLTYGTPLYAGIDGNGSQAGNPRHKWGPRFGFAYSANEKTVVRGGWGVFWAPQSFSAQSTLGYSQPTPIITSFDGDFTPAASLSNPYPTGLLPIVGNAAGTSVGIGRELSLPYMDGESAGFVHQFSFDLQRQLPSGFALSVGFIGSASRDLHMDRDLNQVHPDQFGVTDLTRPTANPFFGKGGVLEIGGANITRAQLYKPFPQYTRLVLTKSDFGRAAYNSVYVKLQRRMAQGLTTQATYTWSQKMELESASSWQNVYDQNAEYGISDEHSPHRLSMAATYELPFGKGKKWLSNGGLTDIAFGGWSLNMVTVLQTGYPLGITQSNNNSVLGARAQRPNATGLSPEVEGSVGDRINSGKYLDRAAFSAAPQFTFGNLAYNIGMRDPAWMNVDASMFKTFSIGERIKAQFRAEALNFTNTPYFAGPNTNINSGAFGSITSQRNFSRLVQFGVRFFM